MNFNRSTTRRQTPSAGEGPANSSLRQAICIYLIGECPNGASIADIARLRFGGRSATEEVKPVSDAVSQLVREEQVVIKGNMVVPIKPNL